MSVRLRVVTLTIMVLTLSPFFLDAAKGAAAAGGGNMYKAPTGTMIPKMTLKFVKTETDYIKAPLPNKPPIPRQVFLFTAPDSPKDAPVRTVATLVGLDDKKGEPIETIKTTMEHLKEGDFVTADLERIGRDLYVKKIKEIVVKPEEINENGYIFKESYNEAKTEEALVRLTKYDQSIEMRLPATSDGKKMVPDPDLVSAVEALKPDQAVYIQSARGPKGMVLLTIMPYKDHVKGKITSIAHDTAVDGGKTESAVIETDDGKSITALVPGKTIKNRFTADIVLARTVHTLKPGTEVEFLTRDVGDKSFFVDLKRAPAEPKSASGKNASAKSSATPPMKDEKMKDDKDAAPKN